MNDQEQKEVRRYCAFLLHQYGLHFPPDDPVIPALFVIHKEMQSVKEGNEHLATAIKDAVSKINPKEFHFHQKGEAFKFQLGSAVKWILMGIFILIILLTGVWHLQLTQDARQANELLKSSEEVGRLITRIRKDDKGNYFIDFRSTEFKRLTPKTIRINLEKEIN